MQGSVYRNYKNLKQKVASTMSKAEEVRMAFSLMEVNFLAKD